MNTLIIGLLLFVSVALVWLQPAAGPGALVMCAVVSAPTIFILARTQDERTFLMRLFIVGLLVRIVLASVIYMGHMEAVSYTHLRAHETPEHLVCRLLLEK